MNFINGKPIKTAETFAVLNPYTGEKIADVARSNVDEVKIAIESSHKSFPNWANLAAWEHEKVLLTCADALEKNAEKLTDILIDESGSCITKSRYETGYTPRLLRAAAGEATRLYGETMPNERATRMTFVVREPIGVVVCIVPFNAPLALLAKMVAFPLAAGNTVVVKPSEETPLIALEFAKILTEAGLPDGVLNVVNGYGHEIGETLITHKHVRGVALTGSTATGQIVGKQAINGMKHLQLELGGKNPLIVLDDFDATKAAEIAAEGIFTHSGQICMANSRVLVQKGIADEFCAKLVEKAESLFLGDLRDERTFYGTLINQKAIEKVDHHVKEAIEKGAKLLTGGRVLEGLRYAPTVLLNPPKNSLAWCEESFAPLVSVTIIEDLDEGIALANDSDYGLSAGILTNDVQKGFTAARQIKAGSVHIGMHPFQSNALAPIGGYGMSGVGRSGGKYSVEAFTEEKWISLELGSLPIKND
jgi:acyl-CoA reductase-like NAD-dependent aldehyde dehydrogenase